MNKLLNKMNKLGIKLSEGVSGFIGTWKFVFIYTTSMILWITLHKLNVLHIDSAEFMNWNLFLSYFAGIQASILLMAAERQSLRDRARDEQTHKNTKKTLKEMDELRDQVDTMTNVLDEMIGERFGKIEDEVD